MPVALVGWKQRKRAERERIGRKSRVIVRRPREEEDEEEEGNQI
jgi:hypothetical protein